MAVTNKNNFMFFFFYLCPFGFSFIDLDTMAWFLFLLYPFLYQTLLLNLFPWQRKENQSAKCGGFTNWHDGHILKESLKWLTLYHKQNVTFVNVS